MFCFVLYFFVLCLFVCLFVWVLSFLTELKLSNMWDDVPLGDSTFELYQQRSSSRGFVSVGVQWITYRYQIPQPVRWCLKHHPDTTRTDRYEPGFFARGCSVYKLYVLYCIVRTSSYDDSCLLFSMPFSYWTCIRILYLSGRWLPPPPKWAHLPWGSSQYLVKIGNIVLHLGRRILNSSINSNEL